ncbi:unnamed protein product [Rotaria sordida]|uniref:TIR domain-containing protein n=1 Tax=Rotaria sordida TaxID=392033 RepID=A0A815BDX5_9BILA|nr:unnamed protein product [Rotaria sordida]CAF3881656.1 unnamed protein product [Rotaria sordida]
MATQTIQTDDIDSDDESSILSWNDNDSSDIEEEAETVNISDERIFSSILTKLQYLQSNISRIKEAKSSANKENESCNNSEIKTSKSSETELSEDDNEEQRLDKTVLVEWYHILVELVNVIEDSKNDITQQNYFAVRKQTKSLSVTINTSKTWLQDDDTAYAHEIVDLYFNFFNLQHIKNYLTSNANISDAVKFTHEDGIQTLNALNLMSILKEVQTTVNKSDSYFQETAEILCMTVALLSTPEQIKNDRKQINIVLDGILNNVVLACGEQDYRYQRMFHVSEPLVVLVKLFSYDRTLDYVIQHADVEQLETTTTLEFLLDFFFKYYATVKHDDPLKLTTMTALCNIFWSVSLRPQYKQELCEDEEKFEEFKKLIKQITRGEDNKMIVKTSIHYVPTYIENIQKAADGILCNILEQSEQQSATQNSERCGVKRLRSLALSLRPSLMDSSSTLKPSKPSIMISYSHGDNDVCTQLYHELNKKNDEFYIWIDRQYCKTGYLWGKIADGMQAASIILCLLSNKKSAVNLDEKPISQWDKDDVAQWFQQNKIMPELYKLYQFEDGPELLTYAATILDENILKLEQQVYSQAYSQENNGKVLLTPPFSRFTNALQKLHHDTKLKMQKTTIAVEPIIMNASNSVGGKPATRNISRIPRKSSITKPQV